MHWDGRETKECDKCKNTSILTCGGVKIEKADENRLTSTYSHLVNCLQSPNKNTDGKQKREAKN